MLQEPTVVLCVLSVTLVYCGQTVRWIKMPLGTDTEVDFGPGDIVLDGDPAPPTERSRAASTFRPMSISAYDYCGQKVAHLINCWALASGQTYRHTDRHACRNTSHIYRGWSNKGSCDWPPFVIRSLIIGVSWIVRIILMVIDNVAIRKIAYWIFIAAIPQLVLFPRYSKKWFFLPHVYLTWLL